MGVYFRSGDSVMFTRAEIDVKNAHLVDTADTKQYPVFSCLEEELRGTLHTGY